MYRSAVGIQHQPMEMVNGMFAQAAALRINKITTLVKCRGLHTSLNALYQPYVLRLQNFIDEPDRLQLRGVAGALEPW